MNEVSLKPVIAELEDLFSKFNARFFADKLEKPVITVSPDHTREFMSALRKRLEEAGFPQITSPKTNDAWLWDDEE